MGFMYKLGKLPPVYSNVAFHSALAPTSSVNAAFGSSLSIDSTHYLIGAPGYNNYSGRVYVYKTATNDLLRVLENPNAYSTTANDNFGYSVAIGGNYAIVGARGEGDAGGATSGKVYVFNVTTGALVRTLNNPTAYSTSSGDNFGYVVALSGNNIVVSAVYEDDAGGTNSGKVYIFDAANGTLLRTLNNPNAGGGTSGNDEFGSSIAVYGEYCVIGAKAEEASGQGNFSNGGIAYVYNITTGALVHTITNPVAAAAQSNDAFGTAVAINDTYVVVTANGEGLNFIGKTFVFNLSTGALVRSIANPNAYSTPYWDSFGSAAALDGNTLVVSATGEQDVGGQYAGKSYVFNITTGALIKTLDNQNATGTSAYDYFGHALAIKGNRVLVSAINEDVGSSGSGSVYLYTLT